MGVISLYRPVSFFIKSPLFLQRKCFNAPLQSQELEGVKDVVREHEPTGVSETGLTEIGKTHHSFTSRRRPTTEYF